MKIVLIVLGALLGLVALVALVGLLLSREHRASRSIVLHQPPDSVWTVIRDFSSIPAWWSEMKRAERLPDEGGKERWHQNVGGFEMPLEVTEEQRPRRLVTRILSAEGAAFGGRWIYEIEPVAAGSRVTVTEDGWIGNVLFRTMAQVTGLDRSIKQYLVALGGKFGETVEPTD
ncbi:MAG: SRPBCC family protein [Gemmatimonadales bacterium]